MDMLPKLDKELALTLSCKLTEYFNFVFVDLDNIDQSVAGVQRKKKTSIIHFNRSVCIKGPVII